MKKEYFQEQVMKATLRYESLPKAVAYLSCGKLVNELFISSKFGKSDLILKVTRGSVFDNYHRISANLGARNRCPRNFGGPRRGR